MFAPGYPHTFINVASKDSCMTSCLSVSKCSHFVLHSGYQVCFMCEGPMSVNQATDQTTAGVTSGCGVVPSRAFPQAPHTSLPASVVSTSGMNFTRHTRVLYAQNCNLNNGDYATRENGATSTSCMASCLAYRTCTRYLYYGEFNWCFIKRGLISVDQATVYNNPGHQVICGLMPDRLSTPTQTPRPTAVSGSAPTVVTPLGISFYAVSDALVGSDCDFFINDLTAVYIAPAPPPAQLRAEPTVSARILSLPAWTAFAGSRQVRPPLVTPTPCTTRERRWAVGSSPPGWRQRRRRRRRRRRRGQLSFWEALLPLSRLRVFRFTPRQAPLWGQTVIFTGLTRATCPAPPPLPAYLHAAPTVSALTSHFMASTHGAT